MVGLLDIAPLTETVPVGGAQIEVFGVSAKGVVSLLARFPEVRMLMNGKEVGVDRLMQMGGDAIAAVIAAGVGLPGDEEQEQIAARLPIEAQADLLAAIIKVTLPNGIGPFVEKLTALGAIVGSVAEASPKVQVTKSPK
ncbi:MAG: hypothetical protein EOS65_02665 [Mesorhizobium sp.]|uniref:phage pre-tape measure protein n=1 Tax=Mesorhizobium sp. TaxID=1871066 RepID=UPI000FE73359|nr:hypothetical protein [Mesorhizobium sp.]RWF44297.1 MAG: hypothetical protein EOS65_02665 [Mesorhizobium sp.]